MNPNAKEFIYGNSQPDGTTVRVGGSDMVVGGFSQSIVSRRAINWKYNPDKSPAANYTGRSYITETDAINSILAEKRGSRYSGGNDKSTIIETSADPLEVALTRLANVMDTMNKKICEYDDKVDADNLLNDAKNASTPSDKSLSSASNSESIWKIMKWCPCKIISFITITQDDITEMIAEFDVDALYQFTKSVVLYASVYTDEKLKLPEKPPVVEIGTNVVNLDGTEVDKLANEVLELEKKSLSNASKIEIYRDKIAELIDTATNSIKHWLDKSYKN